MPNDVTKTRGVLVTAYASLDDLLTAVDAAVWRSQPRELSAWQADKLYWLAAAVRELITFGREEIRLTDQECDALSLLCQHAEERARLLGRLERAEAALLKVRSYNASIAAGLINYRPCDHIAIIDAALRKDGGP